MLHLYLLKRFRLLNDGEEVTDFRSLKSKALLVYLVMSDEQPIVRSDLQTLFWSDYALQSAQANLRVTLSHLRQLIGHIDGLLTIDRYTVYFDRNHDNFWCDLYDDPDMVYGQALLPDLQHIGSPPFQAWLETQQEMYTTARMRLSPFTNIPRALAPLFGRDELIVQLRARVLRDDTPFVTILGVGGVGKTQLALAIGRSLTTEFKHGTWFLSLNSLPSTPESVEQIAIRLLGLLQKGRVEPDNAVEQLFAFLRRRSLLLILDNAEHLVGVPRFTEFVHTLLQEAPLIHLLVTTRRRLAVPTEWVYQLESLPVPPEGATAAATDFASVQLFHEKARRVWTKFTLTPQNEVDVAKICRLLNGLPLGIELAAGQIAMRATSDIAADLTDSLTNLMDRRADKRHASLQAVFDHSWRLLSHDLQRVLTGCALFREAFSLDAAQAVSGGSAEQIFSLVQHSLLQQVAPSRFDLHPTISEFVRQKLAASAHRSDIEQAFWTYYLHLVTQQEEALWKLATNEPIAILRCELTHIHDAWRLAAEREAYSALEESIDALWMLYQRSASPYVALYDLFKLIDLQHAPISLTLTTKIWSAFIVAWMGNVQDGIEQLRAVIDNATTSLHLVRAYNRWGAILSFESKFEEAALLLERALSYSQSDNGTKMFHERLSIQIFQAYAYHVIGNVEAGDKITEQLLPIVRTSGYTYFELTLLYDMARHAGNNHRFDLMETHLTTVLQHAKTLQLVIVELLSLIMLGSLYDKIGDHERARESILNARAVMDATSFSPSHIVYAGHLHTGILIACGDIAAAEKISYPLLEKVDSQHGYTWEIAHLAVARVALAKGDVAASEAALAPLRSAEIIPANAVQFQEAEVRLGMLNGLLTSEQVDLLQAQMANAPEFSYELSVYGTVARALRCLGDEGGAMEIGRKANAALLHRANQIEDPTLREQFITYQSQQF